MTDSIFFGLHTSSPNRRPVHPHRNRRQRERNPAIKGRWSPPLPLKEEERRRKGPFSFGRWLVAVIVRLITKAEKRFPAGTLGGRERTIKLTYSAFSFGASSHPPGTKIPPHSLSQGIDFVFAARCRNWKLYLFLSFSLPRRD